MAEAYPAHFNYGKKSVVGVCLASVALSLAGCKRDGGCPGEFDHSLQRDMLQQISVEHDRRLIVSFTSDGSVQMRDKLLSPEYVQTISASDLPINVQFHDTTISLTESSDGGRLCISTQN